MAEAPAESPTAGKNEPLTQAKLPAGWLSTWPWITFLLPFVVFMVLTMFEPKPPEKTSSDWTSDGENAVLAETEGDAEPFFKPDSAGWLPEINYHFYPVVYTAKIVLVAISMLLVWPGYRTFPFRVSWLSVVVGSVGVVVWVGLCELDLEVQVFGPIDRLLGMIVGMLPGLGGAEEPSIGLMKIFAGGRSAFNPLKELADTPMWAYGFLTIRFVGLALLVPIFEEFLYRGLIMRYVVHGEWWKVPFGQVNRAAIVAGTLIPASIHPGELFAAVAWFSLITWLMLRTKNIWDCVVAHAVTNLLLGIYVVWSGNWQLM